MRFDDTPADLGDLVCLKLENGAEYRGRLVDIETAEDAPSSEESVTLRIDGLYIHFEMKDALSCDVLETDS